MQPSLLLFADTAIYQCFHRVVAEVIFTAEQHWPSGPESGAVVDGWSGPELGVLVGDLSDLESVFLAVDLSGPKSHVSSGPDDLLVDLVPKSVLPLLPGLARLKEAFSGFPSA